MTPKTIALVLDTLRLRGSGEALNIRQAWSTADVSGLVRLIAYEGGAVWLFRRLKLAEANPLGGFFDELRTAAQHAAVLALRVDAQAASVLGLLRGAGIPVALIKGQARRAAAGLYPYADARGVADVDLLLPEALAKEGWEVLVRNRYEPCYPDPMPWKVLHHLPALWDENRVAVELHTTTTDSVPATEAWRRATEGSDRVTWNGASVSVPSATELVWQAAAHAVRDGTKGYRLSAFLNVAAVLAEAPPIQWTVIEERIAAEEVRDQDHERAVPAKRLHRWLATAASLAGTTLPPALAKAGRIDLERLLLWNGIIVNSRFGPSVQNRLLEEGARSEAGMPLSPAVPGTGLVHHARRRSTSLVARLLYASWGVSTPTPSSSSVSGNPSK
jgi:hypothetical protein